MPGKFLVFEKVVTVLKMDFTMLLRTREESVRTYAWEPMLFEQPEIRGRVRAVAWRFAKRWGELEEFEEEGAIFIWHAEQSTPGQSPSWYVQRWCRHLRDVIRSGRSVDARKREQRAVRLDDPQLDAGSRAEVERALVAREDTFAEASARDLFEQLAHHLHWPNDLILKWLTEGWGMRAIGMALGISATTVYEHVVGIRAAARRMGVG